MAKKGLYANIHARRKSGKKMRKKGDEGAPTNKAFKEAATKAYKKIQDGNEPYWQDPEVNEKAEKTGFGLQEHQFDHHPMIHQTVNMIWSMYKSVFEEALGKEIQDYNN